MRTRTEESTDWEAVGTVGRAVESWGYRRSNHVAAAVDDVVDDLDGDVDVDGNGYSGVLVVVVDDDVGGDDVDVDDAATRYGHGHGTATACSAADCRHAAGDQRTNAGDCPPGSRGSNCRATPRRRGTSARGGRREAARRPRS